MSLGEEDMASVSQIALSSNGHPEAEPSAAKGPIRILCDEIGFPFDRRLERRDLLVAFVAELVSEVRGRRDIGVHVAALTGHTPSDSSATVLGLAEAMVLETTPDALKRAAEAVHDASHELNPDDAYPTDHLIDMLSSCASAIRFGLESPCRSRHAAEAANHVFRHVYGVSRFDSHTADWSKGWARTLLSSAILSLLVPSGAPLPADAVAVAALAKASDQ